MSDIYTFTSAYDFSRLELSAPVKKGGTHMMKFSVNDGPVYLQPPKCFLKSGFIKSGKNIYCDILFGIENERFMNWVEQLERHCVSKIYAKRGEWLDTDTMLEMEDIQNYLQSVGKPAKAGSMYQVRTTVPSHLGNCELKVYSADEREISHESLRENMRVITILEMKGLNCSAHSFQFVFELKQMMLSPEKTFDRCIIRASEDDLSPTPQPAPVVVSKPVVLPEPEPDPEPEPPVESDILDMPKEDENEKKEGIRVENVEFNLDDLEGEPLHLVDRNDVYYKMYQAARKKAKEAKILAIANYLEAKRIKTTFLEDMDLDSDTDAEDLEELAQAEE